MFRKSAFHSFFIYFNQCHPTDNYKYFRPSPTNFVQFTLQLNVFQRFMANFQSGSHLQFAQKLGFKSLLIRGIK